MNTKSDFEETEVWKKVNIIFGLDDEDQIR